MRAGPWLSSGGGSGNWGRGLGEEALPPPLTAGAGATGVRSGSSISAGSAGSTTGSVGTEGTTGSAGPVGSTGTDGADGTDGGGTTDGSAGVEGPIVGLVATGGVSETRSVGMELVAA